MDILKKNKSSITPTCVKELLEKRMSKQIVKEEDREKMIKEPKTVPQQNSQPREPGSAYRAPEPYPKIVNAMPNRTDVKQLKMLATGRNGELTAILTYLYQYYIFNEDYPEIANSLEQISIIEMKHYELISKAIVEFGGDPNLTNGQGDIWTGRNVDTEKNIKRALLNNIKGEEDAIMDYTRAAKETTNQSLAALYLRIAEDETQHIIVLKGLLKRLND
ncbi:MAG: ferritin family protein [Clostridia bacterium]|nr:ferritin family protein [Clostridia bacterium]